MSTHPVRARPAAVAPVDVTAALRDLQHRVAALELRAARRREGAGLDDEHRVLDVLASLLPAGVAFTAGAVTRTLAAAGDDDRDWTLLRGVLDAADVLGSACALAALLRRGAGHRTPDGRRLTCGPRTRDGRAWRFDPVTP